MYWCYHKHEQKWPLASRKGINAAKCNMQVSISKVRSMSTASMVWSWRPTWASSRRSTPRGRWPGPGRSCCPTSACTSTSPATTTCSCRWYAVSTARSKLQPFQLQSVTSESATDYCSWECQSVISWLDLILISVKAWCWFWVSVKFWFWTWVSLISSNFQTYWLIASLSPVIDHCSWACLTIIRLNLIWVSVKFWFWLL